MEWLIDDDNLQSMWNKYVRTAVYAESRWVGKTFETEDTLLGNNNDAARLKL